MLGVGATVLTPCRKSSRLAVHAAAAEGEEGEQGAADRGGAGAARQQLEQVDFSYVPNKYLDAGFMATHQMESSSSRSAKKKQQQQQHRLGQPPAISSGDQLQTVIEQVRAKQEKQH